MPAPQSFKPLQDLVSIIKSLSSMQNQAESAERQAKIAEFNQAMAIYKAQQHLIEWNSSQQQKAVNQELENYSKMFNMVRGISSEQRQEQSNERSNVSTGLDVGRENSRKIASDSEVDNIVNAWRSYIQQNGGVSARNVWANDRGKGFFAFQESAKTLQQLKGIDPNKVQTVVYALGDSNIFDGNDSRLPRITKELKDKIHPPAQTYTPSTATSSTVQNLQNLSNNYATVSGASPKSEPKSEQQKLNDFLPVAGKLIHGSSYTVEKGPPILKTEDGTYTNVAASPEGLNKPYWQSLKKLYDETVNMNNWIDAQKPVEKPAENPPIDVSQVRKQKLQTMLNETAAANNFTPQQSASRLLSMAQSTDPQEKQRFTTLARNWGLSEPDFPEVITILSGTKQ